MKNDPNPSGEGACSWASTKWLDDHLSDADLLILDVQPDVHDYILAHIPGAVYLNEKVLRSARDDLPSSYAPEAALEAIFSEAGIDPDRPVLVYSSKGPYSKCSKALGDGLEQPMTAYSLLRFGQGRVFILDGGLEKWEDEGREVAKEFPTCRRSSFKARVRTNFFVGYDEFKRTKDREDVVVFDARPAKYYEESGLWSKSGHIPGAVSLPWRSFVDEENPRLLKPEDEIRSIVREHGLTPEKTVYVYCGTGREATNEFLILKYLIGHDKVRVYEGSFTEWVAHPENETVVGKRPN